MHQHHSLSKANMGVIWTGLAGLQYPDGTHSSSRNVNIIFIFFFSKLIRAMSQTVSRGMLT